MADKDEIVMTPTKKGRTTSIHLEKKKKKEIDSTKVVHEGGGAHSGLVINKQTDTNEESSAPHLQLEFKCFLVDNKTGNHLPESRVLKFWFNAETDYLDRVTGAYEFFKELVKPDSFPRDYVGFIKKVMKQMQQPQYEQMKRVNVDLMQLDQLEGPPPSPDSNFSAASGLPKEDLRPKHVIVQERLLMTLESAYPNILPTDDLASLSGSDSTFVTSQLRELEGRKLIKQIEDGRWVRQVLDEKTEVKMVKQMPTHHGDQNPTVAIITAAYYEKLAVDSMMENKTTFVRYKTEGESNVYTIGYIGHHKVVSTKLPSLGRHMAAQISSGNTTTRLLGTFSDIEHVFLVGVAGGVPHYTDFYKHPRLGDVVVACPNANGLQYIFCDNIVHDKNTNQMQYTLKSWAPISNQLLQLAEGIRDTCKADPTQATWMKFLEEGQQLLQNQIADFSRPPPESDRLFMNIGGNDVIEVGHPPVPEEAKKWERPGVPTIRFGAVGSGKPIVNDDALRLDFSARHSVIAFDTEFDQVLESIVGNRKDSFIFIRGIADYKHGAKNKEWQPYAALAAASYMKTILNALPEETSN